MEHRATAGSNWQRDPRLLQVRRVHCRLIAGQASRSETCKAVGARTLDGASGTANTQLGPQLAVRCLDHAVSKQQRSMRLACAEAVRSCQGLSVSFECGVTEASAGRRGVQAASMSTRDPDPPSGCCLHECPGSPEVGATTGSDSDVGSICTPMRCRHAMNCDPTDAVNSEHSGRMFVGLGLGSA